MHDIRIVTEADPWDDYVSRFSHHDFYNRYAYHRIVAKEEGGMPVMVVYENGDQLAIMPFLKRSIEGEPELSDGISVYGYCGPLSKNVSHHARLADALLAFLKQEGIVSLFFRLNPVLPIDPLAGAIGEVAEAGETVWMDLRRDPAAQFADYSKNLRNSVRQLSRKGVVCRRDIGKGSRFQDFIGLYRDSMDYAAAGSRYYFSDEYFWALLSSESFDIRLYYCEMEGETTCGGLFSFYNGIVQYHLSGTKSEHRRLGSNALLLDQVRREASDEGQAIMHLGGGVGSREDSLFFFKSRFSSQRSQFRTLKVVSDYDAYERLCRKRADQAKELTAEFNESFFPLYRSPLVRSEGERL